MSDPLVLTGAVATAALGAAVVAMWSRRDAVTLLTVYLALELLLPARLVIGPLGAVGTPAVLFGLGLAGVWASSRVVPSLGGGSPFGPVHLAVLGYTVWAGLTYGLASLRPLTELEVSEADRSVIHLAALLGIMLVTADVVDGRERLERLLDRLVLLTCVVALVGAVQFLTDIDPVESVRIPGLSGHGEVEGSEGRSIFERPYSTALHPIEFGLLLAMMSPIALHLALYRPKDRWALARWAAVGLIGAGMFMSVSRSSIVVVAVAGGILATAWSWRRWLNMAGLAMGFVVALRLVVPGLVGTVRSLFEHIGDDPSVEGRTEDFVAVFRWAAERPVVGRGFGTYNVEQYRVLDNQYFETLIESGVPGLVALVFMLALAALVPWSATRGQDEETRHLGLAVTGAITGAAVAMFMFDGFSFPSFAGLLFLLMGVAAALWRLCATSTPSPGTPSRGSTSPEGGSDPSRVAHAAEGGSDPSRVAHAAEGGSDPDRWSAAAVVTQPAAVTVPEPRGDPGEE